MTQPILSETIKRDLPVIDQGPFRPDVIKELQYSLNASYYDASAVADQI